MSITGKGVDKDDLTPTNLVGAFQVGEFVDGVNNVSISDIKQTIHQVHVAQVVEEGVWGEHSHTSHLNLTLCGGNTTIVNTHTHTHTHNIKAQYKISCIYLYVIN